MHRPTCISKLENYSYLIIGLYYSICNIQLDIFLLFMNRPMIPGPDLFKT